MSNINANNNHTINYLNSNLQKINSKKITCWNCSDSIFPNENEKIIKCHKCNKYNSVSNSNIFRNKNPTRNIFLRTDLNSLENNNIIDNSEIIITCPNCNIKNRFHTEGEELICYNCSKNINPGYKNYFPLNSFKSLKNNIIGWRIVPSQEPFLSPPTPFPQNYFTPSLQTESNTDYLLKKILKNIEKQNSESNYKFSPNFNKFNIPSFIPFPIMDYNRNMNEYIDRNRNYNLSEIRYIPIEKETEKPKKDGYKITIRKKKKKEEGLSKSTIFEKVFYLK